MSRLSKRLCLLGFIIAGFGAPAQASTLVQCELQSSLFWTAGKARYVGYIRPSDDVGQARNAVLVLPEARFDGYQSSVYGFVNDQGAEGLVLGIGKPREEPIVQQVIDDITKNPARLTFSIMEGNSRRYLDLECKIVSVPNVPTDVTGEVAQELIGMLQLNDATKIVTDNTLRIFSGKHVTCSQPIFAHIFREEDYVCKFNVPLAE